MDQDALGRLDRLIERTNQVREWGAFRALAAQAGSAIAAIAGKDSDYYKFMETDVDRAGSPEDGTHYIREALTALRSDVEAGYLRRTADLIAADVFGDFLDMAEHLLTQNYHVPAASLIGAVLEDGVKRLAVRNDLAVKPRDDLSGVNHRLADKGVYSNLVRKQVEVWSAVRNHADHGEFDNVKPADVQDMYTGVVRFLTEQLG